MKNILFLPLILLVSFGEMSFGQISGKQFISGSAGLNFYNAKMQPGTAPNGYGYQFDILLGTFKTETKATGWELSSTVGGGKNVYTIYPNGDARDFAKSGINHLEFGFGRFWQFYKHFNAKTGVFAGPDVNLSYQHGETYSTSSNGLSLLRDRTDKIRVSAGLRAGLYYQFSAKWWLTASLAFSTPVSVDYSFVTNDNVTSGDQNKNQQINYLFSPEFSFPSVGFGLRYFYTR